MKAFAPATLLALAGAASACTFAWRAYKLDGELHCAFEIYLENDVDGAGDGTRLGAWRVDGDGCKAEDVCQSAASMQLEDKYEFCLEGSSDDKGKVDGKITVQREGGGVVNIKSEKEGEELVEDDLIVYYRNDVECPGANPAKPTGK